MASAVASPTSPHSHPWMNMSMNSTISFSSSSDKTEMCPAPTTDKDFIEFEFQLDDDPAMAKMISADELFSNGKLLPLRPHQISVDDIRPPVAIKSRPSPTIALESDPYVFSPKAPSCSSHWRELLGLKKSQSNSPVPTTSASARATSLKYFIHRNTRSDSALSLPFLHRDRDSDADSVTVSARLSLSSSSSSERNEQDIPRLSLDSDKIPPRVRMIRARLEAARAGAVVPPVRCASVDSPRMNSSGKIVFQGLERSSSSPGSFNGGPGPRPVRSRNGMERSYSGSANVVRVSPVLNVPVCSSLRGSIKSGSVFGLGQLFSPQKKDRDRDGSVRPGSALARTASRARV